MTGAEDVHEWQEVPAVAAEGGVSKGWLIFARVLTVLFRPTYYPTVAFFFLLNFTFLQMLSLSFRLYVLTIVYLLTFAVPHIGMYLYKKTASRRTRDEHRRFSRVVPYVIHILSYLLCLHFVWKLRMPSFVLSVIAMAICLQCVCTILTIWWKVSVRSAAVGTIMGALVVYSSAFGFNPVWWLCVVILVSGLVNSSCMLLRLHTFWQVLGGTWIGIACGLIGIMLV